jgi:hypothetical protein
MQFAPNSFAFGQLQRKREALSIGKPRHGVRIANPKALAVRDLSRIDFISFESNCLD